MGGRPGLLPREAQLDHSQLLPQQSSPQTELPESRSRRRFKTHGMDFSRGSAGAGSDPWGMHGPPCAAHPPQILWKPARASPARPWHCGKYS